MGELALERPRGCEESGLTSTPEGTVRCRHRGAEGGQAATHRWPSVHEPLWLGPCPVRSSHGQQEERCPLTSQLCPWGKPHSRSLSLDLVGTEQNQFVITAGVSIPVRPPVSGHSDTVQLSTDQEG